MVKEFEAGASDDETSSEAFVVCTIGAAGGTVPSGAKEALVGGIGATVGRLSTLAGPPDAIAASPPSTL